nr:hypothetical protein [uncultured Carboxylicivirga sp.]
MNRNQIFKNFLLNPSLREHIDISDKELSEINLQSNLERHPLLEVIKSAILHLEDQESIDVAARRINQTLKRINL